MTRKNVTVERNQNGLYELWRDDRFVIALLASDWKLLGLKGLALGETAKVDLRVSGLPKKRKR